MVAWWEMENGGGRRGQHGAGSGEWSWWERPAWSGREAPVMRYRTSQEWRAAPSGRSKWETGHYALFVWSLRAPSMRPDWNPVILTRGAQECCNKGLALRHYGIMVNIRFILGDPPPNIAEFADMVVSAEPTSCEHKNIDDP